MYLSGRDYHRQSKAPAASDGGASGPALSFCDEFASEGLLGTLPGRCVDPLGTTYEITQPPLSVNQVLWRLRRFFLQSQGREIMPEHRLATCCRRLVPRVHLVEIWKSQDRAHYKGLMTCGSIWVCPVCAARISEFRRQELIKANRNWTRAGGAILHVVQTVPHNRGQGLKQLLDGFGYARRLMRNRKPWKAWQVKNHLAGTLRSLEVTFGFENGWHVHSHEEFFFPSGVVLGPIEAQGELYSMWVDACKSAGLGRPTLKHGLQVQDGSFAAGYMAKWGIESEVTKSHIKHARGGNYGPFDMLQEYSEGKEEFSDLFREYAKAFHGKKQLHWSKGMRELVGIGSEESDEELAGKIEEDAVFLGSLDRFLWSRVLAADKRGELLEVAAAKGWEGVLDFIADLL